MNWTTIISVAIGWFIGAALWETSAYLVRRKGKHRA